MTVDNCTGSPTPGTVCADGSIYAGQSPDGDIPMYTTPADTGQFTWSDGTSTWVDTGMVNCENAPVDSCKTGEANTALLVGLRGSGSPGPYKGAEHCDGLVAHGHDDWYLPAKDELTVVSENSSEIGNFDTSSSGWYSSSTEFSQVSAWRSLFSIPGGGWQTGMKTLVNNTRCVRKQ